MHSSRMRTGCSLTVCCSLLRGGVSAPGGPGPWGVPCPRGGLVLGEGVPGPGGGGCLVWGMGLCLVWGGAWSLGGVPCPGGGWSWGRGVPGPRGGVSGLGDGFVSGLGGVPGLGGVWSGGYPRLH